MAKLTVTTEGRQESVVEIGERLTIGRSASNALVLDDHRASRHHAEISHLGRGRYRLSDMGSANGTWLNGRRVTTPKELQNKDEIQIGGVRMRFETDGEARVGPYVSASTGTKVEIRNELIVVLVADVRAYTTMSEALPCDQVSQLMNRWFGETTEIIDANGGTVDKFIGDAVMAYWVAGDKLSPAKEVNLALKTAREMVRRARSFSGRISGQFPGHAFGIGVGLNLGNATLCNVGTPDHQSFTVVGDTVNVAFRLEPLTKANGCNVIVSKALGDWASKEYLLRELGETKVKGRSQGVSILGLEVGPDSSP